MPLEIEILSGPLKGKRLKLPTGIHMVGRGLGPLPFQDLGLSQEHAKIHVFAHRIEVEDVGSTNGTFVNGSKVARQLLKDGDEVRLGPESTFRILGEEPVEGGPRQAMAPSPRFDTMQTPTPAAARGEGRSITEISEPSMPAPPFTANPGPAGPGPRLEAPRKGGGMAPLLRVALIALLAAGGAALLYSLARLFKAS
jgi:hypothetical protein